MSLARNPVGSDPTPGLKTLIELPYRVSLESAQSQVIGDLASQVRGAGTQDAWRATYLRALSVSTLLLAEVDDKIEQHQQQALRAEDPLDARGRLVAGPRRQHERTMGDAKTALQHLQREWSERLHRQQDHAAEQMNPWFRDHFRQRQSESRHGLQLDLDPVWWNELIAFLQSTCSAWRKSARGRYWQQAQQIMAALPRSAQSARFRIEPAQPAMVPDARLVLDPIEATRFIDVSPTFTALFRSTRSTMMMVAAIGALAAKVALGGSSSQSSSMNSGDVQATLTFVAVLIAIPAIFLAYSDVQHHQKMQRERGLQSWRESTIQQLRAGVTAALDRQRRALERWLELNTEQWSKLVDDWFATQAEPLLAQAESDAQEHIRQLKMKQAKAQEEMSALRALRTQLAQTILPDLRRRCDELST